MFSEIHPQHQSSLLTRLPREILDKIYLEVWRTQGLRQHILFHPTGPDGEEKHFCRWECSHDYRVDDPLQADVEDLRTRLDVPLGSDLQGTEPPEIGKYCRRLMSPWLNHWQCGERATHEHGLEAISGYTTSGRCWKTWKDNRPDDMHVPAWSPYLPMLLTCKLVSAQCLKSIYESITFIFTDVTAIQAWFGYRPPQKEWEVFFDGLNTPSAFHKFVKSFELSLDPDFGRYFKYGNTATGFSLLEHPHDGYNFDWLHLSRFENLRTVKIWVNARSKMPRFDRKAIVVGIKELDMKALTKSLHAFAHVQSVTISTPLGASFKPEEGCVKDFVLPNTTLYKRGLGDRFHPWLNLISDRPESYHDNLIHTCRIGEVRLAMNGGGFEVMKEV